MFLIVIRFVERPAKSLVYILFCVEKAISIEEIFL